MSETHESTERRFGFRSALALLFLLALALRLYGLDWDQKHYYHPDERRIAEAVTQLSWKPLQLNPNFFAYGSFPFYVTRAVSGIAGLVKPSLLTYDGAFIVGRALSALFGALTVVFLGLLGRKLYGERAGLLAAGLLAITVQHLQSSHFATNDIALALLVLLALYALVKAGETGRLSHFTLGGALIGLSVASKFSAMPMFLPLAVAVLVRMLEERRFFAPLAKGIAAGLTAIAAFAAGQPYALLTFRVWMDSILEQSRMVRNAGNVPYTNQYMGVPKGLYEIEQIVLWGMAPLLGIVALWATARLALRLPRGIAKSEWILLSFAVPFFLISASFDVKFPRYMLPLYPLFVLWGAERLTSWADRGLPGRLLRGAVVVGTGLWCLAFLSIYGKPHSAVTASEWVYRQVPAGARIAIQDWDEGFPFALPGERSPDRYDMVSLSYYEEDSPAKIRKIAQEIATSDWVVLQTKRLYGAVTQAESRFPLTSRYFHMLFAGDLGFTLEREFASRPTLFGIQIPDELADESFSVYDHPKAVLFRNTKRLPAEEIEEKILRGRPSRTLTRNDILLARPGREVKERFAGEGTEGLPIGLMAGGPATVRVLLLVELLGLATYVLLARALSPRPGLFAFSKVVGVVAFGLASWLLGVLHLARFTRGTLLMVLVVLVVLAALAARRTRAEGHPLLPKASDLWLSEGVFLAGFVFFLAVRFLKPEIFWGEKPMDFSFLNALYRTSELPPPEPWYSGKTLSYTYFGHFVAAAIGKLTGVAPAVLFNVAIGLFAGLLAAALHAAGTFLAGRKAGLWAVLLGLFAGNLDGPAVWMKLRSVDFHAFWATSRVVEGTVNEYPFWSFTFADLHAHLMAMPFAVAFVAALMLWLFPVSDPTRPPRPIGRVVVLGLLGVLFVAIVLTSGWSLPTYASLLLFVLAADAFAGRPPGFVAKVLSFLFDVVAPAAAVFAIAFVLTKPFRSTFSAPSPGVLLEEGPYARASELALIFGLFLAIAVPVLFALHVRSLRPADGGPLAKGRLVACVLVALLLPLSLVDLAALVGAGPRHAIGLAASHRVLTFGLFFLGVSAGFSARIPRVMRLAALFPAFALAILAGTEVVTVEGRMNTLFKFYLDSWLIFAVGCGALTAAVFSREATERTGISRGLLIPLRILVGAVLAVCLGTAAFGVSGWLLKARHVAEDAPRFTLDGTAYLATRDPREKAAYDWLNHEIRGIPVLVEAWGESYLGYARFSMNTGLPIVAGWEHHVKQRGADPEALEGRKADIALLYGTEKEELARAILDRYRVSIVVAADLEKERYGGGHVKRFAAWTDLLTPIYRNASVTLYAVNSRFPTIPVTTIEKVEPASGGGDGEKAPQAQSAPGVFNQPRGLAFDADGSIWVADFGNHRIQKLDAHGEPLLAVGQRGKEPLEFDQPCAVAVGPGGIYVADTWNGRVQVLDREGAFVREMKDSFFGPRGLAVAKDGRVFLADTGNHRIFVFSPEGGKATEFARRGGGPGELFEPQGIALSPGEEELYVADNGNARVSVFTPDGKFLRAFPVAGWKSEALGEPHLAFSPNGLLWMTVPLQSEIRAYTKDGTLVKTLGKTDLTGPPGIAFDRPLGIAFPPGAFQPVVTDANGTLWAIGGSLNGAPPKGSVRAAETE